MPEAALQAALAALRQPDEDQDATRLAALIDALRPPPRRPQRAAAHVQALIEALEADTDLRTALREALLRLLARKRAVHCFTDVGILSADGFFTLLSRRLSYTLLPEAIQNDSLKDLLAVLFRDRSDFIWIQGLPEELWLRLLHTIDFRNPGIEARALVLQILDALQIMSYRITAIGLRPDIVRVYPQIERYESPFLMQNVEGRQYLEAWRTALGEFSVPQMDDRHWLVLLEQCDAVIAKIRKQAEVTGASVELNHLLVRLRQNIDRCAMLLGLLHPQPQEERNRRCVLLLQMLVEGENRKNSLRDLISQSVELLAARIAGNAGKTGESYITQTRAEYWTLFRSATGAGLLVAIMAAIKLWLAREAHAPFVEALRFSLMYASGFVMMSLCNWSLATKQPAMTANRLAHSLDEPEQGLKRGHDPLEGLAELVVRTLRSQFIAIVGNFVVAIPLAAAIAYCAQRYFDYSVAAPTQLEHLREGLNPLNAQVWLWAALTGVWLFVCGLLSGYYDNKAVYDRIPQRLRQLRWLRRLIGQRGAEGLARYVDSHLGAIAGSAIFGILLGSTAALGKVFGAPLDTLHVTFSAANLVYAQGDAADADYWLRGAAGIAAIGIMNITVSFGLALYVAMRAHRVRFSQGWALLRLLFKRMYRTPSQFLFPPREAPPAQNDPETAKEER